MCFLWSICLINWAKTASENRENRRDRIDQKAKRATDISRSNYFSFNSILGMAAEIGRRGGIALCLFVNLSDRVSIIFFLLDNHGAGRIYNFHMVFSFKLNSTETIIIQLSIQYLNYETFLRCGCWTVQLELLCLYLRFYTLRTHAFWNIAPKMLCCFILIKISCQKKN